MNPNDTLTLEEFDHFMLGLQEFLSRLRPTIQLADRNQRIRAAVDSLHELVAVGAAAKHSAGATPRSAAPATVSAPTAAEHSAPTGTFDETVVLDFIRGAGRPVTRGAIIRAFGVKPDQVQYRLKRLVARNLVVTKGKRGSTTFRAVSGAAAPAHVEDKTASSKKAAAPKHKPAARRRSQSGSASTDQSMLALLREAGPKGLAGPHLRDVLNLSERQFRTTWGRLQDSGQAHKIGNVHLTRYHIGAGGHATGHDAPKPAPIAQQPKAAASSTPAKSKPKKRRGGVTKGDIKTVLDFIAKHPGSRAEGIAKGLSADLPLVKAALKTLRKTGSVTFTGIKRGTSYTAANAT